LQRYIFASTTFVLLLALLFAFSLNEGATEKPASTLVLLEIDEMRVHLCVFEHADDLIVLVHLFEACSLQVSCDVINLVVINEHSHQVCHVLVLLLFEVNIDGC
jgi:hypothetical protein